MTNVHDRTILWCRIHYSVKMCLLSNRRAFSFGKAFPPGRNLLAPRVLVARDPRTIVQCRADQINLRWPTLHRHLQDRDSQRGSKTDLVCTGGTRLRRRRTPRCLSSATRRRSCSAWRFFRQGSRGFATRFNLVRITSDCFPTYEALHGQKRGALTDRGKAYEAFRGATNEEEGSINECSE